MAILLLAVGGSIAPVAAEAACNFDSSNSSSYFLSSVPGVKLFEDNLPDYEYNNRYYATEDAATELAECLGGTVTTIGSGFAPGSPYVKPDAYGVTLPNGQVVNAGDALTMYLLSGADQGGTYYNNWVNYVNLPDAVTGLYSNYSSAGGTITTGAGTNSTGGTGNVSVGTTYAKATSNIANQVSQSYKTIGATTSSGSGTSYSASLSGSTNTNYTTTGCVQISADLRLGDAGAAVVALTQVLLKEGFLYSAQTNFDQTVFSAVVQYQEKYAAQILTPVGLSKGTGFVGPATRNFINSQCTNPTSNTNTNTNTGTGTTNAGGKSSNFNYTFTKVGNLWKVTLDNRAYGSPTDHYYIPANYSITKATKDELNLESQGRFNSSFYFPGTAEGNTFYGEMFSAFIRAFYDWDNKTK